MPEKGVIEVLSDIKEAITRIKKYTAKLNYDMFLKDIKTQDAVIRNFEVIGEAVKSLPYDLKTQYSQIPWNKIAGIRDRLIHHYFGVNYEIVWTIIKEDLLDLLKNINNLLINESK